MRAWDSINCVLLMIMHVFATSLEVLITETMAITSLQNSSNYLKLLHGNFTTALHMQLRMASSIHIR